MNTRKQTNSVCSSERIDGFLNRQLSESEQLALEEHLSDCSDCRNSLDERAADQELWDRASRYLRNDEDDPDDDFSGYPGSANSIEQVLDPLQPTGDPGMLGRLGGYEVSGVIGASGMGVVLKANDRSLERTLAIKVLATHLASSGSARHRFAREAKAAAAVLHPNVIAIHGVSDGAALPFLVMPYVRGSSLQRRIEQHGPLPPGETLRIGWQKAPSIFEYRFD